MKKILLLATCALFFIGCNWNPSKEARIQQLETSIQQTSDQLHDLESSVQALESRNEELHARILELEKDKN